MSTADRPLNADLHTHSTASDGMLAPEALIHESARRGLTHIALTDHDTTAGLAEALEAGARHGVTVIPGIELSARVDRGELHILGYGIDPAWGELQSVLERLRADREMRSTRILERLRDLDIHLDEERVAQETKSGSIGRPHIARAMVEAGVVKSVAEGFDRYLRRGAPAFVPRPLIEPDAAIRLIRGAGGIAVLAHPFTSPGFRDFLPQLMDAGLSGIECYYGEYGSEQRSELASLATASGLLATGGSDFHGPDFREGRDLGSVSLPRQVVRTLLDAIGVREVDSS